MPTSAVNRCRTPSTAAASRAVATALPSSTKPARQQRAGPPAAAVDDRTGGTGRQEEAASTAKSRAVSSKSAGVERSRLGHVVHQQVRVDVHSDQSARSSSTITQQQQQQQQPPGRSSRSTPANDARRTGLPRSSGSTSTDVSKSRSRSSSSTVTGAVRQTFPAVSDNDKTLLPRLSSSSSTSNAEKSEEELEKMRILARHIKIYTDWANHYLQKLDTDVVIADLQADFCSGVLLADLVHAVTNECIPDINKTPQDAADMVRNIELCLRFLGERGAAVDDIEPKNIRAGSLKSVLRLLFNLSCYKQQLQRGQLPTGRPSGSDGGRGSGAAGPSDPAPSLLSTESPAMLSRLASPFRGKPATTTSRPDNSAVSSASSTRLDRTHQSPNYSHPQQHQQRAPENDQVWQNSAQRPLSPVSNGKSRSVDARPAATSPATGVKARPSTSETRDVASPVPQRDAKPASMLNRFKLFNSRDRTSAGAAVKDVNGVAVQPSSTSQETSPAPRRQLPTYSSTKKGSGSQIPSYSAGTFPVDDHQLPQPTQSGPSARCGTAGIGSPGRPQRQRAPPPPERHVSPGLQAPRRGTAVPAGLPSDQYAGEAGSTNSFGFVSGSSNRFPQQRAIQSRRSADRSAGGSNSREIFIDQPPGAGNDVGVLYDGSRSSSSSVPSRTESSTSISSIASSSTTGGGVASARRSGLARRVSSSVQPDRRNGKVVSAAAGNGSSSRAKSAKPSSSSIPAPSTPGSINRATAKQSATSAEASAGGGRRQKGSASTTTKDGSASSSVATTETTTTEHEGKAGRGLIARRNSARAGQLVDKDESDVMSPSSGRKLPQIVDSRRSATPGRPADAVRGCTLSSEAGPVNRKLTADSSMNAASLSKPLRMPQPSVSATVPCQSARTSCSASPPPTSPRLSAPATTNCDSPDVEQCRQVPVSTSEDDRHPTTPVSVTAPPSPAMSGQALMYRSASVGRPTKEKSSSSISSGFGDESNNSTSDSTDSVIFQPPPSSSSTASRQNASRVVAAAASSTKSALCESSSSAIDSDSPPSETTAVEKVESPSANCSAPPPTHQTVDHITSLRGSRRQSSDDIKSSAPAVKAVSSPVDECHAPTPGNDSSAAESSPRTTTELVDAFDGIKPMQPLIRSSIPCCVYEPSTRRLPTLLAQSTGGGASRRLVFSRPPIGPGVVTAGGRAAVDGRAGTRGSGGESTMACGYMSDGDVMVRGGGSGRAAVSRAADRLMSGYTSEGGGGVTSYARRMQQRFLEGILAVRQSMERTPQFTDDDSFDECSSNSSDDVAVDESALDEAQVDAILEAADSDSPPSGSGVLPTGRPRTYGAGLRGGVDGRGDATHVLDNSWKKYYIDQTDVSRHQQLETPAGSREGAAPFERGSSQRVTLPLAAGIRDPAAAGILAKRRDQADLQRVQAGRRSSRDGAAAGDRVSTFGGRRDAAEVNAECRTPTVGFALPVSLSARSQPTSLLAAGRSWVASDGRRKPSGLLSPSSRRAAAHSADALRGERLSNYRRGTIPRPGSAGHASGNETESGNDDVMAEQTERPASPDDDCSALVDTNMADDALDRSLSSPDDGHSRCSLTDWTSSSSRIVQDGGQGPAQPSLYPSTSAAAAAAGFHDYVNVSYLLSSRGVGSARPNSGMSTGSAGAARSPWVPADLGLGFTGGRMAMSETESVENLVAAWPSYGTGPLHRSDSFKSAYGESNGGRPTGTMSSSLPRYGSVAQMWREDGAGPCLATFRLAAGHTPFTFGQSPRSSATITCSTAPSATSVFAHKSRLSASRDNNLHSSTLSIGSNSSAYSTAEEQQAQEIRRLRHELESAQAKIVSLSTHLSTNAHVVSAFEQSLSNMTHRLQQLAANTDQKEAELNELRATIELLRQQGHAQLSPLHRSSLTGSIPHKDVPSKGSDSDLIRRHMSSDSMLSVCSSGGSQQSAAGDAGSDKKKKPKVWLKIPFTKAFSRKKLKLHSTSDADSDTASLYSDASLAQSAQAQLSGAHSVPTTPIKCSRSDVMLVRRPASHEESVLELQQQLHEKDMKLTDIRLEALSSAHQLEQLRDTMNHMKNEMLSLKYDNERLHQLIQRKGINPSAVLSQQNTSSSEHRLSLGDPAGLDLSLNNSGSKDAQRITLSIRLSPTSIESKLSELQVTEIMIGIITINGSTTWEELSDVVQTSFKDYLVQLDPSTSLGLGGDSIYSLHIGDVVYNSGFDVPELLPCGYLVGDSTNIALSLKGAADKSVDALAFETLIPKSIIQRYVSLLVEHRRIILCGPGGTGKTFLAHRLAEYLVLRAGEPLSPGAIATFSVDHKSGRELRQYLSSVADQCEHGSSELPCVIILDSLHHVTSLSEVFNGFLSVHYQTSPYIIGTMNQTTSTCSPTNLQLHHNFRWVLCANHMEPVHGFLARYLRRRFADAKIRAGAGSDAEGRSSAGGTDNVVEWIPRVWQHLNKFLETHSSSDVTVGPRLFLSCPTDPSSVQVWFTDLWNYSIVPYLLEAIKEGVQTHGSRVPWEDPSDWVIKTYPWTSQAGETSESPPLLRLRPEDVGYDVQAAAAAAATGSKTTPASLQTEAETTTDPLLNMLMRLQEAAGFPTTDNSHDGNSAAATGL